MTKITEIQTNGRTLVVVPVPMTAKYFEIGAYRDTLTYLDDDSDTPFHPRISIKQSNWKILGYLTKDEISFDVEPYVEGSKINYESGLMKCRYKEYNDKKFKWITKDESFRSLLQSHNIHFTNKFGKHPMERDTEEMDVYVGNGRYAKRRVNMKPSAIPESWLKEWNEAQSHVIDKCVILEKI